MELKAMRDGWNITPKMRKLALKRLQQNIETGSNRDSNVAINALISADLRQKELNKSNDINVNIKDKIEIEYKGIDENTLPSSLPVATPSNPITPT